MRVVRPVRRCSRSLVFPAPPSISPSPATSAGSSTLGSLGRSPKEPLDANPSPTLHFGASPFVLADSTAFSPGFVHTARYEYRTMRLFAPPSTCLAASTPTPTRKSSLRPRGFHPRSPVPPPWFRTTSTVSSAASVAGLLHPAADPGFVAFPDGQRALRPDDPTLSRDAGPAPRRTPRREPFRVTAVAAPLPFQPASRRCSIVESGVDRPPLPAADDPLLPGLRSPFKVHSMRPEIHLPPPSLATPRPKGRFMTRQLRFRTRVVARNRSSEPQAPVDRRSDPQVRTAPVGPVPGNLRELALRRG